MLFAYACGVGSEAKGSSSAVIGWLRPEQARRKFFFHRGETFPVSVAKL